MRFFLQKSASWHFLLLLGMSLGAGNLATAQHLYKCGSLVQDRPCDTEVQQRISAATGRPADASYNPRSSASCAQQGASAKTIAEKNKAGVSLESALAAMQVRGVEPTQVAARQDFVRNVYQREGTPQAVARQIEDDCVARWPSFHDYQSLLRSRAASYRPRPQTEAATATAAAESIGRLR